MIARSIYLLIIATTLGCSSHSGPPKKVCYPVKGELLVKDKPANGALIIFRPQQDNDPANNSDCRIGDPPVLPPRNLDVRASELQVHSSNPDAIGAIVEK